MDIRIGEDLFRLCGNEGRVEYLLDWILGYIDRGAARELTSILSLPQTTTAKTVVVSIPNDLSIRIGDHMSGGQDINAVACWFLATALLMGGGE